MEAVKDLAEETGQEVEDTQVAKEVCAWLTLCLCLCPCPCLSLPLIFLAFRLCLCVCFSLCSAQPGGV